MDALKTIATIRSDFTTKFGIPRQSGLAAAQLSTIVFESEYRDENALRGLDGYSHIWLIWGFSEVKAERWSPMVKPPRLGGNKRMGVFATRSPFRPNPLGLSCVKLVRADLNTKDGPVLYVAGADLVDGTPVYDIKPYLPYADSHPEAVDGFDGKRDAEPLTVVFPPELEAMIPADKREGLRQALACGPIPGYQHDPERRYGFNFAGFDVRFRIRERVLTVVEIVRL